MLRKSISSALAVAILATSAIAGTMSASDAGTRDRTKLRSANTIVMTFKKTRSSAAEMSFTLDRTMRAKLNTLQWTMAAGSVGRPVLSGNQYRLVNAVTESGLKRQKRSVAANLGWLSSDSKAFNVRIKRQAGDGQVRYGDVVALELQSYGWLRYKKQGHGINLGDDDNTPHFIWVVTGGAKGTKFVSGMPFALYNTQAKAEMTHCTRTWGIDLGWNGKSECDSRIGAVSGAVFGANGLFARDGLSGKGFVELKDYICEAGVGATSAALTGGLAPTKITDAAIAKCKKL